MLDAAVRKILITSLRNFRVELPRGMLRSRRKRIEKRWPLQSRESFLHFCLTLRAQQTAFSARKFLEHFMRWHPDRPKRAALSCRTNRRSRRAWQLYSI